MHQRLNDPCVVEGHAIDLPFRSRIPSVLRSIGDAHTQPCNTNRSVTVADSWHAHVYFGNEDREIALKLRETIDSEQSARIVLGRFSERASDPNPSWSYQLTFSSIDLELIVDWLARKRGSLDVLVHPCKDSKLQGDASHSLWLGKCRALDLSMH